MPKIPPTPKILEILAPEPIFELAKLGITRIDLNGRCVSIRRMSCFANYGVKCAHCNRQGTELRLEQHRDGSVHLDLYAKEGERSILMTIDHVQPLSKGGKDHIKNIQPMCYPCNQIKADSIIPREVELSL